MADPLQTQIENLNRRVANLESNKSLNFPMDPRTAKMIADSVGVKKNWTDLDDTPSSITASQFVKGNAGGTALEMVAGSLGIQNVNMGVLDINGPGGGSTEDITVGFTPTVAIFYAVRADNHTTASGTTASWGVARGIASTMQFSAAIGDNTTGGTPANASATGKVAFLISEGTERENYKVTTFGTTITLTAEVATSTDIDIVWAAFN